MPAHFFSVSRAIGTDEELLIRKGAYKLLRVT
jgi:hypothetical protein